MAYRATSTLAKLERIRRAGQRPDYPVVIGDDWKARQWANVNQFLYVDRNDIAEDFTAFAGLHVWFRTAKAFEQVREFAQALSLEAASVTIVDTHARRNCEMLVAA